MPIGCHIVLPKATSGQGLSVKHFWGHVPVSNFMAVYKRLNVFSFYFSLSTPAKYVLHTMDYPLLHWV